MRPVIGHAKLPLIPAALSASTVGDEPFARLEHEVAASAAACATEEHVLAMERACTVLEQTTAGHRSLVNPSIKLHAAMAQGSYNPVFVGAVHDIHALWW